MVHQHFTLVPELTVRENLALANVGRLAEFLHLQDRSQPALDLADRLGWPLDPSALVRDLPVGTRQRIEILKCLATGATVAVFDEPTAVLTPDEVDNLFGVLRSLRDSGMIVVLIAHKLSEIMQIADEVTVLRGGRKVASAPITQVDVETLEHWMVGDVPSGKNLGAIPLSDRGLEVRDLVVVGDRGENAVRGVSFSVAAGEVLGIAGVDGNGQLELAEALAGVRPAQAGSERWVGLDRPPAVAYIPQDRQAHALALNLSVRENLLITGHRLPFLSTRGVFKQRTVREWCEQIIRGFDVRPASADAQASTLSGGNQQKVVVGRSLHSTPDLLVACGPTRGLDVRAAAFVRGALREAAAQGCAVILISGDREELAETAHRSLVLSRGHLEPEHSSP